MVNYKYDLEAALHTMYTKHHHPFTTSEVFIPQRARDFFNPRVAPFIPQLARATLNPAAAPYIPQAVRNVLNPKAPEFIPQGAGKMLNPRAASFIPMSARRLNPEAPVFEPSWLSTNEDLLIESSETSTTTAQEGEEAFPQSPIAEQLPAIICTKQQQRVGDSSNAFSRISSLSKSDTSTTPLESALETANQPEDQQKTVEISEAEEAISNMISIISDSEMRTTHQTFFEDELDTALINQHAHSLKLASQNEMSLVRHVNPISVAVARSRLVLASSKELLSTDSTRPSMSSTIGNHFELRTSGDEFAISKVLVLPDLPWLVALVAALNEQRTPPAVVPVSSTAYKSMTATDIPGLTLVSSEDLNPVSSAKNNLVFGPSPEETVLDRSRAVQALLRRLKEGQKPNIAHNTTANVHHNSYLGNPVMHKIDTSPALSIAIITDGHKASMSANGFHDDMRQFIILHQALLCIDPVIYCGDWRELKDMSVSKIRDVTIGECFKYYKPFGTWLQDEQDMNEPVYTDNGATSFLPKVFGEYNDLGFGFSPDDTSGFRNRVEVAYTAQWTKRQASIQASKLSKLTGYPRHRSFVQCPSPLQQARFIDYNETTRILTFDQVLRPSQVPWDELDDESEDEARDRQVDNDMDDAAQAQTEVLTNEVSSEDDTDRQEMSELSEDKSFQSQVCSAQDGANDSLDYDSGSNYSVEHESDVDETDSVTEAERMSPVPMERVFRSSSAPLPEVPATLDSFSAPRATSFPGGILSGPSFQLPMRPKADLPRSGAVWNLSDIPKRRYDSINPSASRPQSPPSPLACAMLEGVEEADEADDEQECPSPPSGIANVNRAYRESRGIPELGLPSLQEEIQAEEPEYVPRVPTTVSRYRRRQSSMDVLSAIMSEPSDADEDSENKDNPFDHIFVKSPSSSPQNMGSFEDGLANKSPSDMDDTDGGIFGSSPPCTPTRMPRRPTSVTPSRYGSGGILNSDDMVSPVKDSPSRASPSTVTPSLGFSGIISLAVSEPAVSENNTVMVDKDEESQTGNVFNENTQAEECVTIEDVEEFLPPTIVRAVSTSAPFVNTIPATGEVSIADLPEVKETWRVHKIKALILKPKKERAVLVKKNRKVSGATTSVSSNGLPSVKEENMKKQGWIGSIKSRLSSTLRRKYVE